MEDEPLLLTEVIRFYRPDENAQNLFVTSIPPSIPEEELKVYLFQVFSEFGLVYEVQTFHSNPSTNEINTQYAFVKLYSRKCASDALLKTKGRLFIGGQHLKVKFANRKKACSPVCLPYSKCYELANYYLGFNGWTTSILSMSSIIPLDQDTDNAVSFVCELQLLVRQSQVEVIGRGNATHSWTRAVAESRSMAICRAKKQAYHNAILDAFSQLLLVVVNNSKVYVEVDCHHSSQCHLILTDCIKTLEVNELQSCDVCEIEASTVELKENDGVIEQLLTEMQCNNAG